MFSEWVVSFFSWNVTCGCCKENLDKVSGWALQTDFNKYDCAASLYDSYMTEAQSEVVFCPPSLSSLALEEETDSMSQDTADTLPEEDSERDALLGFSGTPEVEDSFL